MKIVFFGSSDFAVSSLRALCEDGFDIIGVVSQPDKPKGRGYVMTPTPVKAYAESVNIPVVTPAVIKNDELRDFLETMNPDCIVVAAYGKILPGYILDYPKYGCINVHASLLPKLRGASPINYAIINGETRTGITTMMMDAGLDTGDILYQSETEITEEDDAETLHDRLAEMGGKLICETLRHIEDGTAVRTPQHGESTYAPLITTESRKLDFSKTSKYVLRQIRGLSPYPCAYCECDGKKMKVFKAERALEPDPDGLFARTGDGYVRLLEVQPESKGRMAAADYCRGHRDCVIK